MPPSRLLILIAGYINAALQVTQDRTDHGIGCIALRLREGAASEETE
jgi:hypothetical protein